METKLFKRSFTPGAKETCQPFQQPAIAHYCRKVLLAKTLTTIDIPLSFTYATPRYITLKDLCGWLPFQDLGPKTSPLTSDLSPDPDARRQPVHGDRSSVGGHLEHGQGARLEHGGHQVRLGGVPDGLQQGVPGLRRQTDFAERTHSLSRRGREHSRLLAACSHIAHMWSRKKWKKT